MNAAEQKAEMTQARKTWLNGRVQEVLREFGAKQKLSVMPRTSQDRLKAITQCYRDLWVLGYRIEKVEALAPRHLAALIQHWRAKGVARSTVQVRWSHLTMWCVLLGKAGMAPTFAQVWPREEDAGGAGTGGSGEGHGEREAVRKGQGGRESQSLAQLSTERYSRLLQVLGQRADLTGYWLVRCVRELNLSREEAVLFEPIVARSIDRESLLVWSGKGRGQRIITLGTAEKLDLVDQCGRYVKERGRKRLGWREQSTAQMTRRYTNLLNYAMGRLQADRVGQGEGAVDQHAADQMQELLASWPQRSAEQAVGQQGGRA